MMYNLLQITSCLESTDNIITSCLGLIEIIKPLLNKLIHRTKSEYKKIIFPFHESPSYRKHGGYSTRESMLFLWPADQGK